MLTEPHVNKENKIDYYGTPNAKGIIFNSFILSRKPKGLSKTTFTTLFSYQILNMKLPKAQNHTKEEKGKAKRGRRIPNNSTQYQSKYWGYFYFWKENWDATLFIFIPLILLSLFIFIRRYKSYLKGQETIKGISWAGSSWMPPKLLVGTFQVEGKVIEDLHPIEAALLLELPLPRIVAIMLDGLKEQKIIDIISKDPLIINILTSQKAQHEYEELFLSAFNSEGEVLSGIMADFFDKMLKSLQEKLWDADIEATKTFTAKL